LLSSKILFLSECVEQAFWPESVCTRSSAVTERPRDALCLSVVSFNIPTAQFFITSYCGFRFTSA